jgi:hypothetical protein
MRRWLSKKFYYGLLAVSVLAYLGMVLFLAADSISLARYKIDATQLRMLSLTIVVPSFAIWFAAFYSFIHVGKYTDKITSGTDGVGFSYLTRGLMVLAISMPINAVIARLLSYWVQEDMISQSAATIITTHLSLIFTLISFMLLCFGAKYLAGTVKKVSVPRSQIIAVAVGLAILSVLYIIATLMNPSRTVPMLPAVTATYYLADPLIIVTIVIPYILLWGFGFYATLYLNFYRRNIGGKIYKQALRKLYIGFFIVIMTTVFLQFLTAAGTIISGWALGAILLLLYVLLAVIAIGYVYIALGAKDLAKLEEVT